MIISTRVPMRVSYFGGGTDILPYCKKHGGAALTSTINRYAYCKVEPKPEQDYISIRTMDGLMEENYSLQEDLLYNGKLDLVKASLNILKIKEGCNIIIYTDVLPESGLGNSSAQTVAIVKALLTWKKWEVNLYELASISYQVERIELGIKGGFQDIYASTFGGFNYIEFHDINNIWVNKINISTETRNHLRKNIILYNAKMQYDSSKKINGHFYDTMIDDEKIGKNIITSKSLVDYAKLLLLNEKLDQFGTLLHSGWDLKKQMWNQVSNPEINRIYNNVIKAGALGGKLLGTSAGGYLLFYCNEAYQEEVINVLKDEDGMVDTTWDFDLEGVQVDISEQEEDKNHLDKLFSYE